MECLPLFTILANSRAEKYLTALKTEIRLNLKSGQNPLYQNLKNR